MLDSYNSSCKKMDLEGIRISHRLIRWMQFILRTVKMLVMTELSMVCEVVCSNDVLVHFQKFYFDCNLA